MGCQCFYSAVMANSKLDYCEATVLLVTDSLFFPLQFSGYSYIILYLIVYIVLENFIFMK